MQKERLEFSWRRRGWKTLIATDIAGCQGVVIPGRNGFLVPVRDSHALATALKKLISDEELRNKFGHESRKIVVESFSEASVIERTIEIYDRVLKLKNA